VSLVPSIVATIHGASGVGKSRLGGTTPAPRLIVDPEGGSRFLPGVKILWDPMTQPCPVWDGTWETCIVNSTNWDIAYKVLTILQTGQHPFVSLVLDSISELQRLLLDDVAGINQPTIAQRGQVLRSAEDFVRKLRDLSRNPIRPIQCILLLALTEKRDGTWKAAVSGKLQTSLPAFVDVVGYYFIENHVDPATNEPFVMRKLLITAHPEFEAKDRTDALTQHYGAVIQSPNLTEMLTVVAPLFGGPEAS
jgi:hypothetical protein